MKRIITMLLLGAMTLVLVACSKEGAIPTSKNEKETVKITSLDANKKEIEMEVPKNPERIAILDLAALDIIDNLGMGDRVVGMADTSIEYLSSYANNSNIKKLGTIKEADLEAVMACDPDVIFIGGRLASSYDALKEIAPVVYLSTDEKLGVVESVAKNAKIIASMFGKEEEVTKKMESFSERIEKLQKVAQGKNAIVGMTTSGSFNLLGDNGRCSIIGREIGFENLGNGVADSSEGGTSSHGNESSFETVVSLNPDFIFVMDRDSAIGSQGTKLAKEIMENELVTKTKAYKNGNIIYLEHPAVWYTAEGGITALNTMLTDIESVIS